MLVAAGVAVFIFRTFKNENLDEEQVTYEMQPQDPEDKIAPTQVASDGNVIKIIAGSNGKGTFPIRIYYASGAQRMGRMNEQELADFVAKYPYVRVEYVSGNPNNNVHINAYE